MIPDLDLQMYTSKSVLSVKFTSEVKKKPLKVKKIILFIKKNVKNNISSLFTPYIVDLIFQLAL